MKLRLILFLQVFLPRTLVASSLSIVNNTNLPINVSMQLPAYTQAVIELKKLPKNQLKLELLKAIHCDSGERVKLAVAAGIDVNDEIGGVRPVIIAISKLNALKALVECGADLNISHEGQKFAIYAKEHASIEVLCFLVEYGVKFFESYSEANDIMYYAIQNHSLKLMKVLIEKGCKVKEMTFSSVNGFSMANQVIEFPEILKYLLQNGLNPNLIDKLDTDARWTQTLLFVAINKRKIESVRILLAFSADPNLAIIWDYKTKTPISAAIEWEEGVNLLLEYGASL